MWLAAGAMFFAGKAAMVWPLRREFGWKRLLAFVFLWVGMDARAFLDKERGSIVLGDAPGPGTGARAPSRQSPSISWRAQGCLWCVARIFTNPLARGWCGMVGLILLLHFGLFAALAVFWRARGVPVTPIMNSPVAATSLAEFWGRRWNKAFRDLTLPLVFRPVARRHGQFAALWVSFAVSGLAHELVISVPAGAGFGLPTIYFLLQALGITLQRRSGFSLMGRTRRWLLARTRSRPCPPSCSFIPRSWSG